MKFRVLMAVVLFGVFCVFVSSAQAEKKPDLQKVATETMGKALDWLKDQQKEDGSWSNPNFPAMTALGLWAFAKSDHPEKDKICAKAAEFVANFAQEDGGIYKPAEGRRGSGGLSTYNTAICMTALFTYDKNKYSKEVLGARKFVAGSQLRGDSGDSGGFGYEHTIPKIPERNEMIEMIKRRAERDGLPQPTEEEISKQLVEMAEKMKGGRADLSNTGWALMAMRQTQSLEDLRPAGEKKVDVDWDAALNFLEKLQNLDKDDPVNYGGFGYTAQGDRGGTTGKEGKAVKLSGFGSMTYAGLESMIYANVNKNDPRVRSAIEWAARHWSVDENPGMGLKGLFYYYNVMGKALSIGGVKQIVRKDGESPIMWKAELIEKLASTQKPEGFWMNTDNQFWENDATLVTSFSILTLQYATAK